MPAVSVALPTYNREALLREAVASIQAQTMADWELIIVDDGSTDDTAAVADSLGAQDARIRVIHQPNRGGAAARNAGIQASRAPLVAFLDDDDQWVSSKLATQCRALEQEPSLGWVYSFLSIHNHDTGVVETRGQLFTTFRELFRGRFVGLQTMLVRRSAIERAGLLHEDRAIWGAEDLEWCLRLAKAAPFRGLPEPLVIRNLFQEHGTLERQARYFEGLIRMYRRVELAGQQEVSAFDRLKKVADLHCVVAAFYRSHGAYRQASAHVARALLTYPPIGIYRGEGFGPLGALWTCWVTSFRRNIVIRSV